MVGRAVSIAMRWTPKKIFWRKPESQAWLVNKIIGGKYGTKEFGGKIATYKIIIKFSTIFKKS
jgi:hypothetical protein